MKNEKQILNEIDFLIEWLSFVKIDVATNEKKGLITSTNILFNHTDKLKKLLHYSPQTTAL